MADLKKVYTTIFSHWLQQKKKKNELWISDSAHQCNLSEKCSVSNIHCRVYANGHICFDDCKVDHSGKTPILVVTNVFICESTGKFHVCNADCNEPVIRSRNLEHVCRMSGLTRGSEYHDNYTASADKGEYSSSTNTRKRKFLTIQGEGREGKRQRHEEWLEAIGLDMKSLNIAIQMVDLLLFNKKRQQLENDRLKKMRTQARAAVTTYKRRCEKADKAISVPYAAWLYANIMQRNRPPPYLRISKAVAERMVRHYAYFCIMVHAKLLKYVFACDDDVPSLKDCIPPILYILKEGLRTTADVPLYTVDMFLEAFLPGENTLNHFGIKKTQFTNVRNRIANGIADSIEADMLCPAKLTVIPIALEDVLYAKQEIHDLFIKLNPQL